MALEMWLWAQQFVPWGVKGRIRRYDKYSTPPAMWLHAFARSRCPVSPSSDLAQAGGPSRRESHSTGLWKRTRIHTSRLKQPLSLISYCLNTTTCRRASLSSGPRPYRFSAESISYRWTAASPSSSSSHGAQMGACLASSCLNVQSMPELSCTRAG